MRRVQVGGVFFVGASLVAIAAAGCGSASEGTLEKQPLEIVASTSQAITPPVRQDCNAGNADHPFRSTAVTPLPLSWIYHNYPMQPTPVYQASVSDLLNTLRDRCDIQIGLPPGSTPPSTPPGQFADCDQLAYTHNVFNIPGAAGYYYRVEDGVLANGDRAFWIAIPIVDITTPSWYQSYPGAAAIHTPTLSHLPVAPPSGGHQMTGFFALDDYPNSIPYSSRNDHSNLWNLVNTELARSQYVMGKVKSQPCIEFVDRAGRFIDYAAELELHDPNSCPTCLY